MRTTSRGARSFLTAVLWAAVAFVPATDAVRAFAQEGADFEENVRQTFREGIDAYKRGHYREAYEKLQAALEMKPESDLIYALLQEAGQALLNQMVKEGFESPEKKDLRHTALKIFKLAEPAIEKVRKDEAVVLKYVEDLKSKDFETQEIARHHLINIGPYAIPSLIPVLADPVNDHFRVAVIRTLVEMRDVSVNAVIEVLNSTDPFMRQQAATILGHVRDERAVAELKRVFENPNESPEVKQFAAASLMKITGKSPADLPSGKELYYKLAEKYYYSHPSVMYTYYADWYVWKWDDRNQKLTYREVPGFAFNEQMAEEACHDSIDLDAEYEPAWPLLANVYFAQYAEAEAGLKNIEDQAKLGDVPVDLVAELKTQLGAFDRALVLSRMVGRKYIYQALNRAMEDDTPLVAVKGIEAIERMGEPIDLPPAAIPVSSEKNGAPAPEGPNVGVADRYDYVGWPLVAALENTDKRVRYRAAEAMVRLNPQVRKLGLELVMQNLVDALGEQGMRVVLVIFDEALQQDKEWKHRFKKTLQSLNHYPVFAASGKEGVAKAKSFPTADMIIVQSKLANEVFLSVQYGNYKEPVVETVFDTLRRDVRLADTPIYILCEDDQDVEVNKRIFTDQAQQYVTRGIDKLTLRDMLDRTFNTPEMQADSKARADELSRDAAIALSQIDPTNTLLPFREAVPALMETLAMEAPRADMIRIPAMGALERYGDAQALDVLAKTLDERTANAAEVRIAAAKAMSGVFRLTHVAAPGEVYEILKRNLSQGDAEGGVTLEIAVGEACGNANLAPEQRRECTLIKRLHRLGFQE